MNHGSILTVAYIYSESYLEVNKASLLANYLETLSELAYVDHFRNATLLKENIFRSLIVIMHNLGKKFRPFLESFLEPLFRSFKKETGNCLWAVEELLLAMEKQVGPNIFKAILEKENSRYYGEFLKISKY